jgi:hypothetical protein
VQALRGQHGVLCGTIEGDVFSSLGKAVSLPTSDVKFTGLMINWSPCIRPITQGKYEVIDSDYLLHSIERLSE